MKYLFYFLISLSVVLSAITSLFAEDNLQYSTSRINTGIKISENAKIMQSDTSSVFAVTDYNTNSCLKLDLKNNTLEKVWDLKEYNNSNVYSYVVSSDFKRIAVAVLNNKTIYLVIYDLKSKDTVLKIPFLVLDKEQASIKVHFQNFNDKFINLYASYIYSNYGFTKTTHQLYSFVHNKLIINDFIDDFVLYSSPNNRYIYYNSLFVSQVIHQEATVYRNEVYSVYDLLSDSLLFRTNSSEESTSQKSKLRNNCSNALFDQEDYFNIIRINKEEYKKNTFYNLEISGEIQNNKNTIHENEYWFSNKIKSINDRYVKILNSGLKNVYFLNSSKEPYQNGLMAIVYPTWDTLFSMNTNADIINSVFFVDDSTLMSNSKGEILLYRWDCKSIRNYCKISKDKKIAFVNEKVKIFAVSSIVPDSIHWELSDGIQEYGNMKQISFSNIGLKEIKVKLFFPNNSTLIARDSILIIDSVRIEAKLDYCDDFAPATVKASAKVIGPHDSTYCELYFNDNLSKIISSESINLQGIEKGIYKLVFKTWYLGQMYSDELKFIISSRDTINKVSNYWELPQYTLELYENDDTYYYDAIKSCFRMNDNYYFVYTNINSFFEQNNTIIATDRFGFMKKKDIFYSDDPSSNFPLLNDSVIVYGGRDSINKSVMKYININSMSNLGDDSTAQNNVIKDADCLNYNRTIVYIDLMKNLVVKNGEKFKSVYIDDYNDEHTYKKIFNYRFFPLKKQTIIKSLSNGILLLYPSSSGKMVLSYFNYDLNLIWKKNFNLSSEDYFDIKVSDTTVYLLSSNNGYYLQSLDISTADTVFTSINQDIKSTFSSRSLYLLNNCILMFGVDQGNAICTIFDYKGNLLKSNLITKGNKAIHSVFDLGNNDFLIAGQNEDYVDSHYGYYLYASYAAKVKFDFLNDISTSISDEIINSSDNIKDFDAYPNPFNNRFNVVLSKENAEDSILEIYDIYSNIILTLSQDQIIGNRINIDLGAHPNGIYIIKLIKSGRLAGVKKVVKL